MPGPKINALAPTAVLKPVEVVEDTQPDGADDNTKQFERNYIPPEFTIKEIRDSIPAHLFERNDWIAFSYLIKDVVCVCLLFLAASFIDSSLPIYARYIAWPIYWFCQGVVFTGLWVLSHECGHQAFSHHKYINNIVGFTLHSMLLVPYYSWKFSHAAHHQGIGHMARDSTFVPPTRKEVTKSSSSNHDELELFEDAPLANLLSLVGMLVVGWPMYLIFNASGQKYAVWTSHFFWWSPIFRPEHARHVQASILGVLAMACGLWYAAAVSSSAAVVKFYVVPYVMVNIWLVLITYLQHTDPMVPRYRDGEWNFQRGAMCTVDRSFGVLDSWFHHITDSHVAHHLFSTMPFWNAVQATPYLKNALGSYYLEDHTFFPVALWRTYTTCRFVEDEGDVVFYKQH